MKTISCQHCDTLISAGDRFCQNCGQPVPTTGQTMPLNDPSPKRSWLSRAAWQRMAIVVLLVGSLTFAAGWTFKGMLPAPPTPIPEEPQTNPSFTVYRSRDQWEQAVGNTLQAETFNNETPDHASLSLPYATRTGMMLRGRSIVQMLNDPSMLTSGTFLLVRDWEQGLSVDLPNNTSAFGFDYHASEDWALEVGSTELTLPKGNQRFIGVVFRDANAANFQLRSIDTAQGGLAVDNIMFTSSYASENPVHIYPKVN